MNIDKKGAQSAVDRGTFFGFIPQRLEKDELNNFPLNILFLSFGFKDGLRVMGSALYEPDLSSFRKGSETLSMVYRNAYGGESLVEIEYNPILIKWRGEKFVNGKSVGLSFGRDWKTFFIHLTMLGLSKGEKCEFKNLNESQ